MDKAAAILFIISGTLVLAFGLFSVLGTGTGIIMGAAGLATGDEEMLIGLVITPFYALFMAIGLVVGPLQLAAGIKLFKGGEKGPLIWVATIASILPVMTVYCAAPSMVAFILGLVALLVDEGEEGEE